MGIIHFLFSFKGRIPLLAYWLKWVIPYFLVVSILATILYGKKEPFLGSFLILSLYPWIAVTVKRFHDRNRSAWFMLIGFIPLLNWWPIVECLFLRGTMGQNKYGADPLTKEQINARKAKEDKKMAKEEKKKAEGEKWRKAEGERKETERLENLRMKGKICRDSGRPFCAWCGFPESSMKMFNGFPGDYYWKYRNKDGSKDKRSQDNFQLAQYFSEWRCEECGAQTSVRHFVNRFPSEKIKAWKITLKSKGTGERTVSDWEEKEGVINIDSRKAHRKSDD